MAWSVTLGKMSNKWPQMWQSWGVKMEPGQAGKGWEGDQRWTGEKVLASPFFCPFWTRTDHSWLCRSSSLLCFSLIWIRFIHAVTSQEIFSISSLGCTAIWLFFFLMGRNGEVSVWFFVIFLFCIFGCCLPLLLNILCNLMHFGVASISILRAENLLDTWRTVSCGFVTRLTALAQPVCN